MIEAIFALCMSVLGAAYITAMFFLAVGMLLFGLSRVSSAFRRCASDMLCRFRCLSDRVQMRVALGIAVAFAIPFMWLLVGGLQPQSELSTRGSEVETKEFVFSPDSFAGLIERDFHEELERGFGGLLARNGPPGRRGESETEESYAKTPEFVFSPDSFTGGMEREAHARYEAVDRELTKMFEAIDQSSKLPFIAVFVVFLAFVLLSNRRGAARDE